MRFEQGLGSIQKKGFTLTIAHFRTFVVLYRKNSNSERDNGRTIKIPRLKAARAGERNQYKVLLLYTAVTYITGKCG